MLHKEHGPLWAHRDFGYISEEGLVFSWKWQLFSVRLAKGWWDEKPSWCVCPDRCLRTHFTNIFISVTFWVFAGSWVFYWFRGGWQDRQVQQMLTFSSLSAKLIDFWVFFNISLTLRRLRTRDFKSWSPHSVGLSGSVDIFANVCHMSFFKNV